jgi:hypothetical protein
MLDSLPPWRRLRYSGVRSLVPRNLLAAFRALLFDIGLLQRFTLCRVPQKVW